MEQIDIERSTVTMDPDRTCERVLFPVTPSQSNGIEHARFVLFHNEDGTRTYYATYTNPAKVIGRMPEPRIKPNTRERDGCVPNVVYSCGSLVHKGQLIVPYGISDDATTFATLPPGQVLAAME